MLSLLPRTRMRRSSWLSVENNIKKIYCFTFWTCVIWKIVIVRLEIYILVFAWSSWCDFCNKNHFISINLSDARVWKLRNILFSYYSLHCIDYKRPRQVDSFDGEIVIRYYQLQTCFLGTQIVCAGLCPRWVFHLSSLSALLQLLKSTWSWLLVLPE
jgi:hypothetical protein